MDERGETTVHLHILHALSASSTLLPATPSTTSTASSSSPSRLFRAQKASSSPNKHHNTGLSPPPSPSPTMPPKKQQQKGKGKKEVAVAPVVVDPAKFHPLLVDIVSRIVEIDQLGASCVPMDADKNHYEFFSPADRNKARDAGFPTARLAITQTLYPHTKPSDETAEPPKQPPPDVRVIYIPERRREAYKDLDKSTLSPRQIGTIGIALRASPFVQFPAVLFADAVCMGHEVVRTMFEPFARLVLTSVPHVHIDAMLLYMMLFMSPAEIGSGAEKQGYGLENEVWEGRREDALKSLRDTFHDTGKTPAQLRAETRKDLVDKAQTMKALRRYIAAVLAAPHEEVEDSEEEKEESAEKKEDVEMKDVAE
ncbi:uncharacterized protein BDZ99DRAFT_479623 [Mytilinidion resinicola]|uniref:Uncharacterized protein n=1 Tax=Mytilinidion resinicola TaxID=574789 RepID=A0A6A6YE57_9PEZI|nr:uncharacterized protein BDZ99DRAFT_479623 [Mytilinidion resinicola]KAF2806365.1 hypothetical protein BDZ99DRAFT_479623 [Mytilinidion resinicola]